MGSLKNSSPKVLSLSREMRTSVAVTHSCKKRKPNERGKKTVRMRTNGVRGIEETINGICLLPKNGMKESQRVGEMSGFLPLKEVDGE